MPFRKKIEIFFSIQLYNDLQQQTKQLGQPNSLLSLSTQAQGLMAPQKMSCKNDAKYMYTGKEMSPMGLGYCAEAEMVGKKMMGRDGKDWIVGTKNGVKIWQRAPDAPLVREEPVLKPNITMVSDSADSDSDSNNEEEVVKTPEPVVEEVKPVPDAPKKRGRPAKAKPENNEAKPDGEEVKPKRKYVRKQKNTEDNVEEGEKKVRKPRAKTEYNTFISEKLKDLREKHKELKTTEYFKMAIAEWKVYKENKEKVVVA